VISQPGGMVKPPEQTITQASSGVAPPTRVQ
jgi:hypothetical protein